MKEKYYEINEAGCSVRCKAYCDDPRFARNAVICGHGFGGHKDNRAAARFAEKYLAKNKSCAVIVFDWPCHGTDGRKKLQFSDCMTYLDLVISDTKRRFSTEELYAYATSFGGYLILFYLSVRGNPFRKIALRCPAVRMYDVTMQNVLTQEERDTLASGKPVLAGFDRKARLDPEFLEELRLHDIRNNDYLDEAENILILHGTKDEIVPIGDVREFADNSLIEFLPVENADHRFSDPKIMDLAISQILKFFAAP